MAGHGVINLFKLSFRRKPESRIYCKNLQFRPEFIPKARDRNDTVKFMLKEFVEFLKEFKVISLAVAFVLGGASTSLVNALVKDVFMPIVSPLLSHGTWQTATLNIGPIAIAYGAFLAELLNFIILAAVIFLVVKKLIKLDKEKK